MDKIITTADGAHVGLGDRVFNYYDGRWGVIENIESQPQPNTMTGQNCSTPRDEWDNYWFDLRTDDGGRDYLDGSRVAVREPSRPAFGVRY